MIADMEAEQAVVSMLLTDPVTVPAALAEVTPEHFTDPTCRLVFQAGMERPGDFAHVCERASINPAQLLAVANFEPTTMRLVPMLARLNTAAFRRRVTLKARALLETAENGSFSPDEVALLAADLTPPTAAKHQQVFKLDDLLAFDAAHDESSLLGDRYLCRTGSLLIVSQSGIGKSVFALQLGYCVATDQAAFFGIAIKAGLKVLVVQAENDLGDMAEAFQGIVKAGAAQVDAAKLSKRLRIVRDSVSTAEAFVAMLRRELKAFPADLIIVDPLMSFTGCDVSDQAAMTRFLRNQLNPVLMEHNAAVALVHHTGKPMGAQDGAAKTRTDVDKSYLGIGTSDLTNWARAVIVLQKEKSDGQVYRVTLAKRGWKAGIIDEQGVRITSFFIEHGSAGIGWQVSDYKPPQDKPPGRPYGLTPSIESAMLNALPRGVWTENQKWMLMADLTCSDATFGRYADDLLSAKKVEKQKAGLKNTWRPK